MGGRVTLTTLSKLKAKWGVAIKAMVVRLRQLHRIDADQARSLYKQISRARLEQERAGRGGKRGSGMARRQWHDASQIRIRLRELLSKQVCAEPFRRLGRLVARDRGDGDHLPGR